MQNIHYHICIYGMELNQLTVETQLIKDTMKHVKYNDIIFSLSDIVHDNNYIQYARHCQNYTL